MFGTRERIRVTIDEGWLPGANALVPAAGATVDTGATPPQWIAEAAERPAPSRRAPIGGRAIAWKRVLGFGAATTVVLAFGALIVHTYVIGRPTVVANGVPLIKADTTPWRIRPADEGGMVVPNQDRLVLQDLGATVPPATVRGFLPPPEAPLPRPTVASIAGGGGVLTIAAAAPVDHAGAVEVLIGREEDQQGSTPASSELPLETAVAGIMPTLPDTAGDLSGAAPAASPALVSTLSGGDQLAALIDMTGEAAPAAAAVVAALTPMGSAEAATGAAVADPWPEIAPSPTLPPITVSTAAGPVGRPVLPAAIAPAFAALDGTGPVTPTDVDLPPVAPLAGGAYAVQIAAVSSEQEVTVEWDRFRRRYPEIFGQLELRVQKIDGASRFGYRVQAAPLDAATAKAVCAALVNEKTGCLVVGGPAVAG